MVTIKSLEDLKKMREEAQRKQELKSASGKTEIIVGMGTVGIAAGARETLKAILKFVEEHNLDNVIIRNRQHRDRFLRASCAGNFTGSGMVTYGHVSPEKPSPSWKNMWLMVKLLLNT